MCVHVCTVATQRFNWSNAIPFWVAKNYFDSPPWSQNPYELCYSVLHTYSVPKLGNTKEAMSQHTLTLWFLSTLNQTEGISQITAHASYMEACTHTYPRTHTHAQALTHTHAHTCMHARTHTHTPKKSDTIPHTLCK